MQIQSQSITKVPDFKVFQEPRSTSDIYIDLVLSGDLQGLQQLLNEGFDPNQPIVLNEKAAAKSFPSMAAEVSKMETSLKLDAENLKALYQDNPNAQLALDSALPQAFEELSKVAQTLLYNSGVQYLLKLTSGLLPSDQLFPLLKNNYEKQGIETTWLEEAFSEGAAFDKRLIQELLEINDTHFEGILFSALSDDNGQIVGSKVSSLLLPQVNYDFEMIEMLLENGLDLLNVSNNLASFHFSLLNAFSSPVELKLVEIYHRYGLPFEKMLSPGISDPYALLEKAKETNNEPLISFLEQNGYQRDTSES